MPTAPQVLRTSRGYWYFAIIFVVVSIVLAAQVGLSLYGRAEIILTATQNRTSGEFLFTVQDLPFPAPAADTTTLPGRISEQVLEQVRSFRASGTATTSADTVGEVTLVNTTARQQVLVATTRIQPPDGPLLRLKDRVVVPAQGKVVALVYPDRPATFRPLPPTRFIIPGLAATLQDEIYAESQKELSAFGTAPAVTAEDLQRAKTALTDELSYQAQRTFHEGLSESERLYTKLVSQEILASSADAQPSERRAEFTAQVKLKIVYVAFDENRLAALARNQLAKQLPFTHELVDLDPATLRSEVQRYDSVRKEASLKVYAEGSSGLRPGSPILNPAAVAGLTKKQIITHFRQYPEVQSIEVKFTPEKLLRAPRSPSRITFTVK